MKKKKELDVDFIGGQASLTKEQEKMISDFLKLRSTKKRQISHKRATKRKVIA